MPYILQKTFSLNKKTFELWLIFHWSLFESDELTIYNLEFSSMISSGIQIYRVCWKKIKPKKHAKRKKRLKWSHFSGAIEWRCKGFALNTVFTCYLVLCFFLCSSRLFVVKSMIPSYLCHYCFGYNIMVVIILRPIQNGHHLANDILKCIFLYGNVCVLIELSMEFILSGPISNKPILVQVKAWHQTGSKPLHGPMLTPVHTYLYKSPGVVCCFCL